MTPDEIRAVLDRRLEALTLRDAAAFAATYSLDCVIDSMVVGRVVGRVAVERLYEGWIAAFPDVTFEREEQLVIGDHAVELTTIQGTNTGGFLGQPPTGKPFSLFTVAIYILRDGHIAHDRRISDVNGFLLQLAGGDAAVALESSRLYGATLEKTLLVHEISLAAQIQHGLLPPALFSGAEFEIAVASVPCRAIGGDFIDYFELPAGAFGFALGDVAGKGPPAALLAGVLQGILAGHADVGGTAAGTVAHVNQVLSRRTTESRFATLMYGVISRGGQLAYCNAGHNPPFLTGRHGQRRLRQGGLILGAFRNATFNEETVQLDRNDLLVVFSDGVTEALNREEDEFGDDRLQAFIEEHRDLQVSEILARLLEAVAQFTDHTPPRDDVTAMVLRYTGPAA